MLTIANIVAELNKRAESHSIGRLQELRLELNGLSRLPTHNIFDPRSTFDNYAFHFGGRTELQFNVGFEDEEKLRHGVAFSLEPSQTLPDIEVLIPQVERFNEFIRQYADEFGYMRMWHYEEGTRSTNYYPGPIPPEIVRPHVFIFLGNLQSLSHVDYEVILDSFDRLLPLYRYVEGDQIYPAISEPAGPFVFTPGCTIKATTATISRQQAELDVYLRHNELQAALHRHLSEKFGDQAVSTEQGNGGGVRIDLVVRLDGGYWFYEIKTSSSARSCIRTALAQLLEYSFWPGVQEAQRLVIVGEAAPDEESKAFLRKLRDSFALPIYYEQFDVGTGVLVDD